MNENVLGQLSADPQKRDEEAHFTRVAATFGQMKPHIFSHFGRRMVDFAGLSPGAKRVLDIACGRGATLFPAAEKVGPAGEVTGIDLSAGMVAETRREIRARGVPNARVMQMDAERLEFEDAQFDVILCAFALHHFPNPALALAEMRRVLEIGGQLVVATWGSNRDERWRWLLPLRDSFMPQEAQKSASPPPAANLGTPEGVSAVLVEAGFCDPHALAEVHEFVHETEEGWWNSGWANGQFVEIQQASGYESMMRFKAEAFKQLAAQKTPEGLPVWIEAVYTAGWKR